MEGGAWRGWEGGKGRLRSWGGGFWGWVVLVGRGREGAEGGVLENVG